MGHIELQGPAVQGRFAIRRTDEKRLRAQPGCEQEPQPPVRGDEARPVTGKAEARRAGGFPGVKRALESPQGVFLEVEAGVDDVDFAVRELRRSHAEASRQACRRSVRTVRFE